ncbi:MAG: mechanosensitive ion channel domain-containing protein [Fluviibacter phosphoraccumulans]|jgi:small-conductance mechanosensitive channel
MKMSKKFRVIPLHIKFRTASAIILLLSSMSSAYAQMPSLFPGKSQTQQAINTSQAPVVVDLNKELADAQSRLGDTQGVINRLQAQLKDTNLSNDARSNLLKQFNQRQTLADRYAQQIDYLKQLQVYDQKIVDAKQQRDNWVAPAGNPPWSVVQGDQVKNEMIMQESRITKINDELSALSDQIAIYGREKSDADVRLRQLQEKLGNDPTKLTEASRIALDEAQMTQAFKSSLLYRADLEKRLKEKLRTLLEIQLSTSAKTWNYFDGRFVLTPEILASAKGDLQLIIDRDRNQELNALAKSETALNRLNKAQAEFQALDHKNTPLDRLAQARANLDMAQANEASARSDVDRLRRLIEMGGYAQQVWDARAALYATPRPSAERVSEIAQSVKDGLLRIAQVRDNLGQALTANEQAAFTLRENLLFSKDVLARQVLTAKLQAANTEADSIRLVLTALEDFEQFLSLLQSELAAQATHRSVTERMADFGDQLVNVGRNTWNYELFSVDDFVIADGKEVKTTRSVTIGKSIGAVAMLLFGFMLISWLIRSSIALAERRFGLKPSSALAVRRWLTFIATGTLIALSFNLVQIPLSIFAFLGGALAIGIGFGAQNVLKNLISGGMLLIERPIKLGDFVEIEGVRGRVTSIGLRVSTIHSSDGIDTLIPNSELVEKKLTNWTFSNQNIRREIKVGVAYDADPTEIQRLIQSVALVHPDVIQSPTPMVVFDDFGDSALIFTLRFWIRVDTATDGRLIDSDLRSGIMAKLKNAGIDIPNPQLDVHLSAVAPLKVSIPNPSI